MFKCDYADERVTKDNKIFCKHKGIYCSNGNGYCEPDTEVEKVEKKDVCKNSSIFGNYYIGLTDEQIEGLKNGDLFAKLGEEYNIFISKRGE